jgi:hypothetical protein
VAFESVASFDFTCARFGKTLCGATVSFHFWHGGSSSLK